jgi:spermidine synthase
VSIGSEVWWTKYLSIFTGATIYGFSAILGVFLIGMALGSWFAKRYLRTHGPPAAALPWALSALGLSLIIARVALALLPALLDFLKESEYSHEQAQALKYLAVFFALLPGTFVFGSLFPYTLSIYCTNVTSLKSRIGVGYAINTAGSVLGAIAAGFWIIPNFGTDALLTVLGLMILALSWLFVDAHSNRRQTLSALAVTCVLLLASFQLPHLNYRELIAAAPYRFDQDAAEGKDPRFIFLEEGKAGVISIVTYDEKKAILQNNGIQESYLGLIPGIRPPIAEVLLGLVPAFLHPNPTSAFVVGFGGGNTLEALADTSIQEITVVELEPAVIAGVASIRGGRIPVLEDPRIDLRLNDARNVLLVDGRGYDLIISQPSHPWLSGAGNLFTKEFFSLAANHLDDGGIFAQWVNLFNMDSATLRSILQAYFLVFPHGFCLANMDSGDLLLFGSQQQPIFDQQRIAERMRAPKVKRALGAEGIHRPADLLWYFALSRDEALTAASDMPPNTDTRIYSEVRLAGMTVDPTGDDDPYQLLRAHSKLDVIPYLRPHEASQMLYQAGQSFYRHFSTALTRRAIARLEDVDPATADRLRDDWAAWRESVRNRGTAPTKRTKK